MALSPSNQFREKRRGGAVGSIVASAIGGVIGDFERGPLNKAYYFANPGECSERFGDLPPSGYTQDFINSFVDNGGSGFWAVRVLGAGYDSASLMKSATGDGATYGSITSDAILPMRFENGDTFIGKVDGGGSATATIVANKAYKTGTAPPFTAVTAGHKLILTMGGLAQTVTFDGTENTEAEWLSKINQNVLYGRVFMDGADLKIEVDKAGSGSSGSISASSDSDVLTSLGLSSGAFTLTGGSNVVDNTAVTAAELVSLFESTWAGSTTTALSAAQIKWRTDTIGSGGSVQFTGGTGMIKLFTAGVGDTTVHSGSATGDVDTLLITASSPGTWGNRVKVKATRQDVIATTLADTYAAATVVTSITVTSVGKLAVGDTISIDNGTSVIRRTITEINDNEVTLSSSATVPAGNWTSGTQNVINEMFTLTVYNKDNLVQKIYSNLRMSDTSPQYVETVINNDSKSFITVANQSAVVADPRPNTDSTYAALSGGLNGSAISGSDVVGSLASKTGLYAFDKASTVRMISAPGFTDATSLAGMETYGERRQDVVMVLDPPLSLDPDEIVAYVTEDVILSSSYSTMQYPWLYVPNRVTKKRLIPPSGVTQGIVTRTHRARNFAKAPAGVIDGVARNVLDVEFELDEAVYGSSNYDPVYQAKINGFLKIPSYGICLYGAQTFDPTGEFGDVNVRIGFIMAKLEARKRTRWVNFENNNSETRSKVKRDMEELFRQWRKVGILTQDGKEEDAFIVTCDESNNTEEVRNQRKLVVTYALAFDKPGVFTEQDFEQLTKSEAQAALVLSTERN